MLCVLYHGSLLLFGTFRGTYDAYVHIFLGDHYARDWFSTWDQRWYTGFTTVSYPPGTHMAIGAISKVVGDLEMAFAITQMSALLLLTVGVYRFSRLWVSDEAAANASLLLVGSSAIAETVHLYGQLPTTFALAFLLNSLPFIRRWLFEGRPIDLITGTIVLAACTAGHHVTTLFGSIFFLGPVIAAGLLNKSREPRDDETTAGHPPVTARTFIPLVARRLRRVGPSIVRGVYFGPMMLLALIGVVFPYWYWSATDPIVQVAIPHGSRANFLQDHNIGLIFFLVPWGLMLPLLPYAIVRAVAGRMWPLAASIGLLFVLGTGGTTPIPKILLGGAFDILTLDRFTFWASILILPLGGLFVQSVERGTVAAWLRNSGGPVLLRSVQIGLVVAMIAVSLFSSTLARFRPFQPARIDPDPIVAFIEKDQHERWRFLTLGFGDQMAWLSAQTEAAQVDGNYHSVRRLPELTSTSVERLEGAKYRGISGLGSLQQFLEVPEKYHLKFVFSNDRFYDPLLHFLGWQRLGPLENGIVVWERADIPPLPAELPTREVPPWQRVWWGVVPPAMICTALSLLLWTLAGRPLSRPWNRRRSEQRLLWGPLRWLDRGLRRIENRLPPLVDGEPSPGPKPSIADRLLAAVRSYGRRPVRRRGKVIRLGLLALVVLTLPLRSLRSASVEPTPEEVAEAYYDDLDFRRFTSAYARLDPQTRPDYELWRLQLSVTGGIVASYAKLDQIDTELAAVNGSRVTIRADLTYLTALDWYPVVEKLEMVERNGHWYVVPEPADLTVPPDQLVRRAEVDYLIQGRRRVTSATSDQIDIQDRPELFIAGARLMERDGLPVVVGEVVNLDVDPADLTITAVLRNSEGEIIGRYNATEHLLHTLRPRESTPFRVDFQDVAAGASLDFDPLHVEPLVLDDEVASVEVYAKAVVTSGGLYRGLGLTGIWTEQDDDGRWMIEGELRNDGTEEAVVPMVLVSFLDIDGNVRWVERAYLPDAIRSQRSGHFSIALPDFAGLQASELPVATFHNGINPPASLAEAPPELFALPDEPATWSNAADAEIVSIRIELATMGSENG